MSTQSEQDRSVSKLKITDSKVLNRCLPRNAASDPTLRMILLILDELDLSTKFHVYRSVFKDGERREDVISSRSAEVIRLTVTSKRSKLVHDFRASKTGSMSK
ncbi:hypothetical protein CERSUDRAFT_88628 [Gelatoporia subvermispora B]|uniref:Uncharacterized protein n=1 Tax=Ceriporiopsis subvermispora (strain B) TaxID=914234 RepID=M2QI29_CERS8|nr:hypothetical protein CERSUDRAFT_88628 [Gelatoporia subvermispora B]